MTNGIHYFGDVYRPPSEAYSLIIQATIGCSHNKCAFCYMYKEKSFSIRPIEDVIDELMWARQRYRVIPRIFLADGDALILPMPYLRQVLTYIKTNIPECERVAVYGSPNSILIKTESELEELRSLRLGIIYMGLETGNKDLLAKYCKGQPIDEVIKAGQKVKKSKVSLSITAISGLGGTEHWQEHAIDTGKAISMMKPNYVGLLTLRIFSNTPLYSWVQNKEVTMMTPLQLAAETKLLLENIDSEGTVFRSNHASNYLVLKGTLNKDTPRLIAQLDEALKDKVPFRKKVELGF